MLAFYLFSCHTIYLRTYSLFTKYGGELRFWSRREKKEDGVGGSSSGSDRRSGVGLRLRLLEE